MNYQSQLSEKQFIASIPTNEGSNIVSVLTPNNFTFPLSPENDSFVKKGFQKSEKKSKSFLIGQQYRTSTTIDYNIVNKDDLHKGKNDKAPSTTSFYSTKISNQAKRISSLKTQLDNIKTLSAQEYLAFKKVNRDLHIQLKAERNISKLSQIDIPLQESNDLALSAVKGPQILIYGTGAIDQTEMIKIIKNKLSISYNIQSKNSDYKVIISDKKNGLKNITPVDSLKSMKYDFIIVGPHPHSIKGKNLKHSWSTFLKLKKINTVALESYKNRLSKEQILVFANEIGEKWFNKEM